MTQTLANPTLVQTAVLDVNRSGCQYHSGSLSIKVNRKSGHAAAKSEGTNILENSSAYEETDSRSIRLKDLPSTISAYSREIGSYEYRNRC